MNVFTGATNYALVSSPSDSPRVNEAGIHIVGELRKHDDLSLVNAKSDIAGTCRALPPDCQLPHTSLTDHVGSSYHDHNLWSLE